MGDITMVNETAGQGATNTQPGLTPNRSPIPMPEATRNLYDIRLSRLTRDRLLRQWFDRNEPDASPAAKVNAPRRPIAGAAIHLQFA